MGFEPFESFNVIPTADDFTNQMHWRFISTSVEHGIIFHILLLSFILSECFCWILLKLFRGIHLIMRHLLNLKESS